MTPQTVTLPPGRTLASIDAGRAKYAIARSKRSPNFRSLFDGSSLVRPDGVPGADRPREAADDREGHRPPTRRLAREPVLADRLRRLVVLHAADGRGKPRGRGARVDRPKDGRRWRQVYGVPRARERRSLPGLLRRLERASPDAVR